MISVFVMPSSLSRLLLMTEALTEEIFFRSYPIERLTQMTGRAWLAGLHGAGFHPTAPVWLGLDSCAHGHSARRHPADALLFVAAQPGAECPDSWRYACPFALAAAAGTLSVGRRGLMSILFNVYLPRRFSYCLSAWNRTTPGGAKHPLPARRKKKCESVV